MAVAVCVSGSVSASCPFWGSTHALRCTDAGNMMCCSVCAAIATIIPYFFIVYLAITSIGFTSIAFKAKQLNISWCAFASARIRNDMVVL